MSDELRTILLEQVDRLLADTVSPALLRGLEQGIWPGALWAEMEGLGLTLALVPDAMGGAGLGWDDAAALWQVLGRHAAPVPLAESMAAAGISPRRASRHRSGCLAWWCRARRGCPGAAGPGISWRPGATA